MTIVFGHNHFRIKSVEPHEVGLHGPAYNNIKFDLQQKYGHLFWIPFIPIGKVWTVNKGDGKKYVCHPDMESVLDGTVGRSAKSSIFAWTGPLLILVVYILFSISSKISEGNSRKRYAEQYAVKMSDLSDKLKSAGPGDILLFNTRPEEQSYFGYNKVPVKIMDEKDGRVLLGTYVSANSSEDVSESRLVDFLYGHKIEDSFWVKKELLQEAIQKSESDRGSFKGLELKDYYLAGSFKLESIVATVDGPYPTEDAKAGGRSESYHELVNNGFDAHVDSLIAEPGEAVSCQLSKQRNFPHGASIAVKLYGNGKYVLYCSDKNHQQFKFRLSKHEGYTGESFVTVEKAQGNGWGAMPATEPTYSSSSSY